MLLNNKYQQKAMTQEENPRSLFFRARLHALIAERDISQRQLAAATKLTPQSVSNYVRGTRSLPGAEELYALAKYFEVSMESFLGPKDAHEVTTGRTDPEYPALSRAKLRRIAKQIERISEELKSQAKELKGLAD